MKTVLLVLRQNRKVFAGMIIGSILGYLYWYYFACYWGTYPMSSECWTNCLFGATIGGFMMSLYDCRDYI